MLNDDAVVCEIVETIPTYVEMSNAFCGSTQDYYRFEYVDH